MDDLKPTDDSTKEPVSQPGDQTADSQVDTPQPTPPEPAPTMPSVPPAIEPEKPPEPSSQTVPTQTTVTTEEPPLTTAPTTDKPSGKKLPSAIKTGGALILLLLAATLPATVIVVQNKTQVASKATEVTPTPTPTVRPARTAKAFIALTEEEQGSAQAEPIKPRSLEIETISSGSVKITFSTQGAYSSLIRYSPDEDWNYLTMLQEGDVGEEWRERYHPENEISVESVSGSGARIEHEFLLENLILGQKYYFVIEIEKTEENIVYLFGLEQPENYYTFIAQ
jgi:hypothetical protein